MNCHFCTYSCAAHYLQTSYMYIYSHSHFNLIHTHHLHSRKCHILAPFQLIYSPLHFLGFASFPFVIILSHYLSLKLMPYRRSFAMYPQSPAMFIRNVDSLFVRHHSHSFIFIFVFSPHYTLRHIQIHLFSYTDQSNVHRWIWRTSGPACIWMTFWRACVWMSVRCACLWMRTNELACAHMYVIWGLTQSQLSWWCRAGASPWSY